jgi:hypothetical protein
VVLRMVVPAVPVIPPVPRRATGQP